jgi:uncharacterized damage-inducible protein DinB
MTALDHIRRLWKHASWADDVLLVALKKIPLAKASAAVREYAHVLGAEEVWLARLEAREPTLPIWPETQRNDLGAVARAVHAAYDKYLAPLRDADLEKAVPYKNSLGRSFESRVADILLHVMLHGQYHRGKINLLLRQAESPPAPVDYIAFARGVPAATAAASLDPSKR